MNYILFDDLSWNNLLPLTFTRPVSEIRLGILTITEKWNKFLDGQISFLTKDYLSNKFPYIQQKDNILVNSSVIPLKNLADAIITLKQGEILKQNDIIIAARLNPEQIKDFKINNTSSFKIITTNIAFDKINYPWDIFQLNDKAIREDFELITKGRKSAQISNTNKVTGIENIFIEEGSSVEFSIINGTTGPIYIAKETEIMEGSMVRGPFVLCDIHA